LCESDGEEIAVVRESELDLVEGKDKWLGGIIGIVGIVEKQLMSIDPEYR
jgi:hypothetical protein